MAENTSKGDESSGDYKQRYLDAQKTCEEYLTRLKYLQADYENLKKRAAKEKLEGVLYANESLIADLLQILDELEAAVPKMNEGDEKNGVELIHANLLGILRQNGLKEIAVKNNQQFDPDEHEAMEQVKPEKEGQDGKVAKVLQKGYTLNGKVLRFAKVAVYVGIENASGEKK